MNTVVPVVASLLMSSEFPNSVLLLRRLKNDIGAGFWEMPGGKVDPGETPEQALAREIEEELGIVISPQQLVGEIVHAYPQLTISLMVYLCDISKLQWKLHSHDAAMWIPLSQWSSVNLSEADEVFFKKLGSAGLEALKI